MQPRTRTRQIVFAILTRVVMLMSFAKYSEARTSESVPASGSLSLLGQFHPAKESGETGIGAKGIEHGIDGHTIGQQCGALLIGALEPLPGLFFFPIPT